MNTPLQFTARVYEDGPWFVAFCPEMSEANGQGYTQEEAWESLKEAIVLLLEGDLSTPH